MSVPSLRERRFELQLHPTSAGDDWGFRLSETFGDTTEAVAKVDATRATQFRRAVLEAVEASGYPPACCVTETMSTLQLAPRSGSSAGTHRLRLAAGGKAASPKGDRRWGRGSIPRRSAVLVCAHGRSRAWAGAAGLATAAGR